MKATSLTPNEFVDTFKYIHAMIGKARIQVVGSGSSARPAHRLKSELPHHLGNFSPHKEPRLVEAGLVYKAFILIRRAGMISWLQRELG